MKTNTTIAILVGITGLLVAGKLGMDMWNSRSVELDSYTQWWGKASPDQVTAVTIQNGPQSLTLTRDVSSWKVNEYPANSGEIQEWLPLLVTPASPEIVAETAANHASLGIASPSAMMAVTVNGLQKTLSLGNSVVGGRYVKLEGSDTVYLVKGLPPTITSTQVASWVDTTIVRLSQQTIQKITWQRQKQSFAITKEGESWKNAEGEVLDTTILNSILTTLESFVTLGMLPQSEQTALGEPVMTLIVESAAQEPVSLKFYQTESSYAVESSSVSGVYSLGESVFDNFDLQPTDLQTK